MSGRVESAAEAIWTRRCESNPTQTYAVSESGSCSVGEFEDGVRAVASRLATAGLAASDVVVVQLDNSIGTLQVHHALRRMSAVIVPIHPELTRLERDAIVEHCEPRWTIASRESGHTAPSRSVAALDTIDMHASVQRLGGATASEHHRWLVRVGGRW